MEGHRFEPSVGAQRGGYRAADVRGRPSWRAVARPARGRRVSALPGRRARRRRRAPPRAGRARPRRAPPRPRPPARPNIVVVMTDDQTLEQMSALPRTRKLIGRQGVKFKRFYVSDPLCCPSRATFLTGQYAHNTGVISDRGPNAVDALREQDTLGDLAAAGRLPHRVRRQVLERIRRSRTPSVCRPVGASGGRCSSRRTQDYFDYDLNEDGEVVHFGSAPGRLQDPGARPPRGRRGPPRGARQPAAVPLRRLQRPALAEHPGARRRRHARRVAAAARPGLRRARPLRQAELPRATARRSAPRRSPGSTRAASGRSSRWPRSTARSRGSSRRCARRASSATPTSLFTSDNGYLDGEHRIELGRLLAYEPASHVPLLIRGPGIPSGRDLRRAGRQRRPRADDRADRRGAADGRARRPPDAHASPATPSAQPTGRCCSSRWSATAPPTTATRTRRSAAATSSTSSTRPATRSSTTSSATRTSCARLPATRATPTSSGRSPPPSTNSATAAGAVARSRFRSGSRRLNTAPSRAEEHPLGAARIAAARRYRLGD